MNDTEICNLALAEIGDNYSITDIDETTPQATLCRRFYAVTRDALLRAYPWSFARHRRTLSALSTAPIFGWDYAFQLPSDFLKLIDFNGLDAWDLEGDFVMEGGKILTDDDTAEITYIRRVEDAQLFDSMFVEAFALKLALRICIKLSKDGGVMEAIAARLRVALGEAKRSDANETRPRRMPHYEDSDLATARRR